VFERDQNSDFDNLDQEEKDNYGNEDLGIGVERDSPDHENENENENNNFDDDDDRNDEN